MFPTTRSGHNLDPDDETDDEEEVPFNDLIWLTRRSHNVIFQPC